MMFVVDSSVILLYLHNKYIIPSINNNEKFEYKIAKGYGKLRIEGKTEKLWSPYQESTWNWEQPKSEKNICISE